MFTTNHAQIADRFFSKLKTQALVESASQMLSAYMLDEMPHAIILARDIPGFSDVNIFTMSDEDPPDWEESMEYIKGRHAECLITTRYAAPLTTLISEVFHKCPDIGFSRTYGKNSQAIYWIDIFLEHLLRIGYPSGVFFVTYTLPSLDSIPRVHCYRMPSEAVAEYRIPIECLNPVLQ